MDGATLQTKIWGGYAKSAARVGLPYDIYRPVSAINPMDVSNKIGTTPAQFTVHSSSGFDFSKPSDYKGPLFHALVDGSLVQRGDYLNDPATVFGPFFIAAKDPNVPILAVQTNRTVTVWREGGAQGSNGAARPVGASGYGGTIAATAANVAAGTVSESAVLTNWPASVLLAARGTKDAYLPGDSGARMVKILLPAIISVTIANSFVITDDIGNRYISQSVELTDLGWNIQAQLAIV